MLCGCVNFLIGCFFIEGRLLNGLVPPIYRVYALRYRDLVHNMRTYG
jgi:hypothetical protein